jgi:hypothetical protein
MFVQKSVPNTFGKSNAERSGINLDDILDLRDLKNPQN